MKVFSESSTIRDQINEWKTNNEKIALVPTMGHLHAGHSSLIKIAQDNAARIVVSIFVNPLQFNLDDDFERYPRTLNNDLNLLKTLETDAVFNPDPSELYPNGIDSAPLIKIPKLGNEFCGKYRPGHFDGVCTVVAKLFNIISPDIAVFGQKDYQQLLILQRMSADLNFNLKIISATTQRDTDGLALSSRNTHLSTQERKIAPKLFAVLNNLKDNYSKSDISSQEQQAARELEACGMKVEYIGIRDATNLSPISNSTLKVVILAAVWLGDTRLIDNVLFPNS